MMQKVNSSRKLSQFEDHWNPRIVGELNGQHVKLAKFLGDFPWHSHKDEDEMFLVVKGSIEIHFRDKIVSLEEGEFIVVPKGVEHRPVANSEAQVMLFEPASTVNTGDLEESELTRKELEKM